MARRHRLVPASDRDLAAPSGVATLDRRRPKNVHDHLLSLQREYGNAAVTGVIVQRKGSKGAKGGKKAPKQQKQENYFPEWDSTITSSPGELRQSANTQLTGQQEWQIRKGIHWYEQAYLRETSDNLRRMDAKVLNINYEKLGDAKRAAWWKDVHTGKIDPFAGEKGHA